MLTYYVNILVKGVDIIKVIESKQYKKSYKKIIMNKHLEEEKERLQRIIDLILNEKNMYTLMLNNYSKIYNIEKKEGNLKEYYTARLNSKIRLVMKPIGDYPYSLIQIEEIELIEINDRHYE